MRSRYNGHLTVSVVCYFTIVSVGGIYPLQSVTTVPPVCDYCTSDYGLNIFVDIIESILDQQQQQQQQR